MIIFLRYCGDAYLETLQAGFRNTKFIPGVETSMAPLWCGRNEVSLKFGNVRTHLSGIVLTQRLDPSTPAHQSSYQHPESPARVMPPRP